MAKQTVGIGSSANDGSGDTLRVGADKINDNFDEIYAALGNSSNVLTDIVGFIFEKYLDQGFVFSPKT